MKKLILAVLAAGSVFAASAQSKATIGIKGGVNFASFFATDDGSSMTATSGSLTSFSAGLFADLPVGSKGLSIQPGLFYTGKGGDSNDGTSTGKIKLNYLQIPVNVVYNVPVSSGKFFFGAGPYAAYGISGQATDRISGRTVSVDVKFGSDSESEIKRTDFGATALVGFEFKNKLLLNVNYDLGLSNIVPGEDLGGSIKNRVVVISLGYKF